MAAGRDQLEAKIDWWGKLIIGTIIVIPIVDRFSDWLH
jgi:hypothetical protein